ncbi:hypothetical protein M409DRAFT_50245 [Zasmidium cellare ATCC 36951]|uniref:Apple domain-containing protein n=1 Tax=Zasmidium cellare ATCC 36951 TaxID=1080233 RepID=A0A6A6CZP8_ZASCE|nr:uncharacterized protein M409DRAFT_50245 [Zasmidium cellare ATCC 36951]KAF2172571.1 hypothetical protein M409DRAFT_50245 [Zasmidium cellare ATCC 36951]
MIARSVTLLLLLFNNIAFAQNTFRCPRDHRTVVTDANGEQYMIGCGDDTYPASNRNFQAANSFNDCFATCSASPTTCGAFTYVGGRNGVGGGVCYLKPAQYPSYWQGNTDTAFVGAINMRYYRGATGTTSAVVPQDSVSCPAQNGKVIRDLSGVEYVVGCAQDTTDGSFASQQVNGGFDDCFNYCSNNVLGTCYYFTFVGTINAYEALLRGTTDGTGAGTCYLKNKSRGSFAGSNNNFVGAVQLARYNGAAITWPTTTTTPSPTPNVVSLSARQAQELQTVYYTTVQYFTATIVTSYPVTATSVSTRFVTFTSSIIVTATQITTLPDVTTTLQLTTIVPTTVVTTQIFTTVVVATTTLQLTTVIPTTKPRQVFVNQEALDRLGKRFHHFGADSLPDSETLSKSPLSSIRRPQLLFQS